MTKTTAFCDYCGDEFPVVASDPESGRDFIIVCPLCAVRESQIAEHEADNVRLYENANVNTFSW